MPNSYTDHVGVNGQDEYLIGFSYLEESYLRVSIDDVPFGGFTVTPDGLSVDLSGAGITGGEDIRVFRQTDYADDERLTIWSQGAYITQQDMDNMQLQLLHRIQELTELPSESSAVQGLPAGGTTGQALVKLSNADYDVGWDTISGGGGAVDSVFGRTGVVVAVSGDYNSTLITNASGVTGATVTDALNTLDGQSGVSAWGPVGLERTGVVNPAASDYDASQIDNDSAVAGATVADALDTLNAGKASGDVNGPASSFATEIVRFDDTSGKNLRTWAPGNAVQISNARELTGLVSAAIDSGDPDVAPLDLQGQVKIYAGSTLPGVTVTSPANGDLYIYDDGSTSKGLYQYNGNTTTWDLLAAGVSGTGTDNNIVKWDGTSSVQDSGVSISDENVISQNLTNSADVARESLSIDFLDTVDNATSRNVKLWVGSEDPDSFFNPPGGTLDSCGDLYIRVDKTNSGNANVSEIFINQRTDEWKQLLSKKINGTHSWGYIANSSRDNTTQPDSDEVLEIESTGTNGAAIEIYVGSREPIGQSFGNAGDIYFSKRGAGNYAGIYVKNKNGDWVPTLTKDENENNDPGDNAGKKWRMSNYNGSDNPDSDPMLLLESTGTNGAFSNIHVGDRDPNGAVSATAGSLYVRVDDASSQLYINTTAGTGTTWTAIGATTDFSVDADTDVVLSMESTTTNPADVDFYVGSRDPNGNVSANEGDMYFQGTTSNGGPAQWMNSDGSSEWVRMLHTGNPQGARGYCNIRSGSSAADMGTGGTPTLPTDAVEWTPGTLNASSNFSVDESSLGSGTFDRITWNGGRTATFFCSVKTGLKEDNVVTLGFAAISKTLAIGYVNGSIQAQLSGYLQTYPEQNVRVTGAFSGFIEMADGDYFELGITVTTAGTSSGVGYFANGCVVTLIEVVSDED